MILVFVLLISALPPYHFPRLDRHSLKSLNKNFHSATAGRCKLPRWHSFDYPSSITRGWRIIHASLILYGIDTILVMWNDPKLHSAMVRCSRWRGGLWRPGNEKGTTRPSFFPFHSVLWCLVSRAAAAWLDSLSSGRRSIRWLVVRRREPVSRGSGRAFLK